MNAKLFANKNGVSSELCSYYKVVYSAYAVSGDNSGISVFLVFSVA